MKLYARILGHPFVFNNIRPLFMGGLNHAPPYEYLECNKDDIILDVGCGMGDALNYLKGFKEYHGFDIDKRAIDNFDKKGMDNVYAYHKILTREDVVRIRPTKVILLSLLHHISDREALELLNALSGVERVATHDAVYCKGKPFSNLLSFLDRGRFVKTQDEYKKLIKKSPFYVFRKGYHTPSKRGWGTCFIMDLRPKST